MFIWDIHFTGNETRTDEALSSFLREKGVFAGMLKKEADCRKIVKEIRTQYDDVVWVSASLDGSRLKIQIKENEDSFEKASADKNISFFYCITDMNLRRSCSCHNFCDHPI